LDVGAASGALTRTASDVAASSNHLPRTDQRAGTSAVPDQVAARLLAEILALDLGTMTPIRALTLLHELQTAARDALPWTTWMANMAGASERSEPE
jgi:hypothetical protein